MAKIKLDSTDENVLGATVETMLGKKVVAPLSILWLIDCIEKMPFSITMKFDKIFGRYICSNMTEDDWPKEGMTPIMSGPNFTFVDYTLEKAVGRAVHYYYHYQYREEVKS